MGDFRIADNINAGFVELALGLSQRQLASASRQLASGLRVQTAADDPSGLAISQSLLAQSRALATGSQNVTNARNAATVADGGLAAVTSILQRVRNLAVEASTTIASDADRSNIQTEISNLIHEIDRISQNTNYNGQQLLDGSHSGFVAAQGTALKITANVSLASVSTTPGTTQNNLIQGTAFVAGAEQPPIWFSLKQTVTASPLAQTVSIGPDAAYVQPNTVFALNGGTVQIQSVDIPAGTITAVFSASGAAGDILSNNVNANSTTAIAAGQQTVTLAGPVQPLYAGEGLQVDYTTPSNEVVVVQKVLGPNTFVADFANAHNAGANFFGNNEFNIGPSNSPQIVTETFNPTATDGAPIGSPAYVIESTGFGDPPPNGSTTRIVAEGTVIGGTVNDTIIQLPAIPDLFGGTFFLTEGLGYGATPVVNTDDGTIKLQIVNTGASIAVQETFYDTNNQAALTSPFLLSPDEQSMLFDGVVVSLGNFTSADVGQSAYIKVQQSTAAITSPGSSAFTVQSGGFEGDVLQLGIPSVSSASLRVSNITVLGSYGAGDPTLPAEDAIGQVDFALQRLLTIRANLGAFEVTLGEESANDDEASVRTAAAASDIADANIPQETTAFALAQTNVAVGTFVLAHANVQPQEVLRLFR